MATAAALWTSPAAAGPAEAKPTEAASLSLSWQAPPACPQLEVFRAWLLKHLGLAVDPAGYPGLSSHGELAREGSGWRLRLTIVRDGTRGEKTLRGRDCEELARSGALVLAIALEPALGEPPASEPTGAPVTTPEPELVPVPPEPESTPPGAQGDLARAVAPVPVDASRKPDGSRDVAPVNASRGPDSARAVAPVPVDTPRGPEGARAVAPVPVDELRERAPITADPAASGPPSRPRLPIGHALRLAAGLELGALPGVGAGVLGGYALRLPGVRIELTGSWWLARRRAYAEPAGVGGRVQVGAAALRVCPTPRVRLPAGPGPAASGLVELPLCAGLELGALVASGFGFAGARTVRTWWAAVELQPGVVWRFTRRLALWSAVALVVPITRDSFAVDPLPQLFAVGAVGFRAGVGLEVHLGREPGQKY